MQTKQLSFFLSLLLTLCLFHDTQAQQAGQIESMKLLTPDVGWAATKHKLFWTTNGGGRWSDITPKLEHKQQTISSVFFLDSSTGWVLLSCSDGRNPMADDVCFEFASTTNAGENWSVVHPKIVDPVPQSVVTRDGQGFSSTTLLDFADAQHGWAVLKRNLHVQASSGVMLRTADGGKTWTQLPKDTLPIADRFRFATVKDGWMAGGGQPESDLYVTHNGGDTWNQVVVAPPPSIKVEAWPPAENGVWPDYRLPYFESTTRGFLIGSYWDGDKPNFALFSTTDLGAKWKFERVLPSIDGATNVADGTLFVASTTERMDKLILTRLALGGGADAPAAATADVHGIPIKHYNLGGSDALEMVDATHGWILADELLATSDGGTTWVDITPGEARAPDRKSAGPGKAPATRLSAPADLASPLRAVPSTGNVSSRLGFDKSDVPCPTGSTCTLTQSIAAMQALMNSSPYYDAYIYLPNSPNRHNNAILGNKTNGPLWVSSAEGQGWGIGPIWFGLQSACIIGQPNVTQYFGVNGADPSTQGAEAADSAVAQDQLLSITSGIIWVNIENYTTGGACSAAVQAYVDGFVTEMGVYNGYSAGVYANPGPITTDISQVGALPAAIWITKTPKTGPPSVTIWNQGISDNLWPNGQRMHQFLINQTGVAWGGIALTPGVDEDIDNGPVVNANNGAKTPSYTYTSLTYPGSTQTCPMGINDMAGGAFISNNSPTSVGEIVGEFEDSQGQLHGFSLNGTTWAQIDYPGAVWTVATGINNAGQIVGAFWNSLNGEHGFKWNSGSPTTIDYPGANGSTEAVSINDAGQIVGSYQDSSSVWHGFLAYAGNFYSFSYPASNATLADGINGDAILTGHYTAPNAGSSYSYSPLPPSWTGSFSAISYPGGYPALMYGVNNDGEFTGYAGSATGNVGLTLSNDVFTSLQFPGQSETFMFSANDFGQIAGYYYSQSDLCVGFVAIPQ